MVLILDGNSEHDAQVLRKNRYLKKIHFKYVAAIDLKRLLISLYTCAPMSEQPPNISTIVKTNMCPNNCVVNFVINALHMFLFGNYL